MMMCSHAIQEQTLPLMYEQMKSAGSRCLAPDQYNTSACLLDENRCTIDSETHARSAHYHLSYLAGDIC